MICHNDHPSPTAGGRSANEVKRPEDERELIASLASAPSATEAEDTIGTQGETTGPQHVVLRNPQLAPTRTQDDEGTAASRTRSEEEPQAEALTDIQLLSGVTDEDYSDTAFEEEETALRQRYKALDASKLTLLAAGSFGGVYRLDPNGSSSSGGHGGHSGHSGNSGSQVVKVVPRSRETERELRTLHRMAGSSYVVHLLHYWAQLDTLYLVQPNLGSKTLLGYRPSFLDDLRDMALHLGSGLKELHERRVFHRDLKPDNVLFGKGGTFRITDLGSAVLLPRNAHAGEWVPHRPTHELFESPYAEPDGKHPHGRMSVGNLAPADLFGLGRLLLYAVLGADDYTALIRGGRTVDEREQERERERELLLTDKQLADRGLSGLYGTHERTVDARRALVDLVRSLAAVPGHSGPCGAVRSAEAVLGHPFVNNRALPDYDPEILR